MSDNHYFDFTTPEDFNNKTEQILTNCWSQVEKIQSFFSSIVGANGPDSFAPTTVVFNTNKDIVGVFTCRPFDGRDDLYQALSELLFFPAAINSELFIVATDSNVKDDSGEKLHDALNIAFISPDFCYIYTLPYTVQEDNQVLYDYQKSYMISMAKDDSGKFDSLTSTGDMIELFFIFSHIENRGPFTVDELLSYYDENNFHYEIINRDNMRARPSVQNIFQG